MTQFTFQMPKFGVTSANRTAIGDALEAGGRLMHTAIQRILAPHNRTGSLIGSFRGRRLSDRSFLLYSDNPVALWLDLGTGKYGKNHDSYPIFSKRQYGRGYLSFKPTNGYGEYGVSRFWRETADIASAISTSMAGRYNKNKKFASRRHRVSKDGRIAVEKVIAPGMRGIHYVEQAKRETAQERGALVAAAARAEILGQLGLGSGQGVFAAGPRIGQGFKKGSGERFIG